VIEVLAIPGSLRSDSYNKRLLVAAAKLAPRNTRFRFFDGLATIPPYDEDADAQPPHREVDRLRASIAAADALLVATPEYNASLPGQLKNAIDWASRPFPGCSLRGKPAAVVGASTGLFGAVWAQAEVRKALTTAGAHVLADELPVGLAHEAFAADGTLHEADLAGALQAIVEGLVTAYSLLSTPFERPHGR
jgi:chromate reductase